MVSSLADCGFTLLIGTQPQSVWHVLLVPVPEYLAQAHFAGIPTIARHLTCSGLFPHELGYMYQEETSLP